MNVRFIDNVEHIGRIKFVGDYQMPFIKKEEIVLKEKLFNVCWW